MKTTIKQRPILFSTPMVQGILQGRKLITRRTNGLERINDTPESFELVNTFVQGENLFASFLLHRVAGYKIKCPYGKPGDQLWVRETWTTDLFGRNVYKATDGEKDGVGRKFIFSPSIHMPRAACRLLLEITDIRVERLQGITETDAVAEGVEPLAGAMNGHWMHYCPQLHFDKQLLADACPFTESARGSFFTLWESINGVDSTDLNPWLWVIKFKVVEGK